MAAILKKSASLVGKEKIQLLLRIRESDGHSAAAWSHFAREEDLKDVSGSDIEGHFSDLCGQAACDLLGLAGLPLNDYNLRLLAHHAIMEANESKMNGQKPRVKVSVLVIFDVWIGLKLFYLLDHVASVLCEGR